MFWSLVRPDRILPPITRSAAVTTSLEAGKLAVGMITCGGRTTVKRCDASLRRPTLTLPSWGMLLQAARRAVRPRPDGALSGGVDFRDASDHGASADTRTPCVAPSRRQRLVSVILVASARLNSRKNKDKSERLVTCFVRVPGMCEPATTAPGSRNASAGWRADGIRRRSARRAGRLAPRCADIDPGIPKYPLTSCTH